MPTRRRLIIAGFLTLFAGLVILFPARVAYNWFAPPGIAMSRIDGTIWSGSAKHLSAGGVYATNVRWHSRPLHLLAGRLAFAVEGSLVSGFIESNLAFGFGGDIYLSELTGSLPVQLLEHATGVAGLQGILNIQFDRLHLSDGLPVAATGVAEVSGLLIPLVSQTPIGGFRAEFFTEQDGVVASIEDSNGIFDLAGSLRISSDRNYQFLGQVAAKPETPPQIREQMRFLGSPNERGQYELRLEGQL